MTLFFNFSYDTVARHYEYDCDRKSWLIIDQSNSYHLANNTRHVHATTRRDGGRHWRLGDVQRRGSGAHGIRSAVELCDVMRDEASLQAQ